MTNTLGPANSARERRIADVIAQLCAGGAGSLKLRINPSVDVVFRAFYHELNIQWLPLYSAYRANRRITLPPEIS